MKKWYFLTFVFYACVLAFLFLGYSQKHQFNYPSSSLYEVFGLDSSHHQGEIDWSKISPKKFHFIYLKASEGESFKDKRFKENYKAASERGIVVGGYHFWTFCKSAEKQVTNILETIPKKKGDLLPAIDIESSYSCGKEDISKTARIPDDINYLNEKLKAYYGGLPIIYTTKEFAKAFPEVLRAPNLYWLRSLVGPPAYKRDWAIWQYYHAGTAKGIRGPVDLNAIRKKSLFRKLLQ